MPKLRRLRINKFRGVAPGTELVFNDTFNVLLGQNGTGKTTLLKLIAMAVSSDFSALETEEFDIYYELGSGLAQLSVAIRSKPHSGTSPAPLPVNRDPRMSLPRSPGSTDWSCEALAHTEDGVDPYRIEISPLGATVSGGPRLIQALRIPFKSPFEPDFLSFTIDAISDRSFDYARIWGAIDMLLLNDGRGRFDETLGSFDTMIGKSVERRTGDCIRPFSMTLVRREATGRPLALSPYGVPSELASVVFNDPELLLPEAPVITHEYLEFLRKSIELFQFEGAEMLLRLHAKRSLNPGEQELEYREVGFTFNIGGGSVITHDALSYGQKRLLSFFYYVAVNPFIVIADELVNGLHYDWIEACLEEIGARQSFLTSQNPLLLDFLPFASPEEVRRCFILCRRERHEGGSRTSWSNMDEESAEAFFRAYQTHALQVSEILRTRGFW